MTLTLDTNRNGAADQGLLFRERFALPFLIAVHIALCCVSLVCVAIIYPEYHFFYYSAALFRAIAVVAIFALVAVAFVYAEFSFGYFVGFYLYTMVLGYLWLNTYSEFVYNHHLAGLSAAVSAVAFLLPVLFIRAPLRQLWAPSPRAFDRLLDLILVVAVVTVAIGASYNFRLVAVENIYDFRDNLVSPTLLNYAMGIVSGALLPFAFACFIERRQYWRAVAVIFLLILFYPITLSKIAFYGPIWLVGVLIASRFLALRMTVVLSLLAPMVLGLILFVLFRYELIPYKAAIPFFGLVNFRMIAVPSLAMDYYNEFFFKHDLTYYCQIGVLKRFLACPYNEPLSIVIYNAFGIGGNFNASLFATEGVASIGPTFAPLAMFLCGLVIALGNRASEGLNPRFVMISGAIFPLTLLNVPFTVVLLSHGLLVLFLLWYVKPRQAPDRG